MRSQFKLVLFVLFFMQANATQARDIILVENLGSAENGQMLLKILQEKFNIPRSLITYKSRQACLKSADAIMQLCLKANGEMDILKLEKFVVENTLGVFLETETL